MDIRQVADGKALVEGGIAIDRLAGGRMLGSDRHRDDYTRQGQEDILFPHKKINKRVPGLLNHLQIAPEPIW